MFSYCIYYGENRHQILNATILGWLLARMALGAHAFGLMGESLLAADWYKILLSLLKCSVGLMIGTELVLKDLKQSGKQILLTILTQSFGAFLVVTLSFAVIFYFMQIPLDVSLIFGSIALATAPAPVLSIVREFKTDGPFTKTLIPMAVLDDVVAIIMFLVLMESLQQQKVASNRLHWELPCRL